MEDEPINHPCLLPSSSFPRPFPQMAFIIQPFCFLPLLLLVVVVSLKRVLQLGGDLLEEADLLTEVVLHLRAEVPYARAVEVLDLCQRGAGNDVAAVVEVTFLLWTVFHLGQCTWRKTGEGGRKGEKEREKTEKVWQVRKVDSQTKTRTSRIGSSKTTESKITGKCSLET